MPAIIPPGAAPPADDTGLQTAVASGTVVGRAVANGFTGVWGQVANMTCVGVLCVVVIISTNRGFDAATANQQLFQAEQKYTRDQADAHMERMLTRFDSLGTRMDALGSNIQAAAAEMRASRTAVDSASREIKAARPPDGGGSPVGPDCFPNK